MRRRPEVRRYLSPDQRAILEDFIQELDARTEHRHPMEWMEVAFEILGDWVVP